MQSDSEWIFSKGPIKKWCKDNNVKLQLECMRKFVALSNLRFQICAFKKKKRVCETLHAVSNLLFRRQMRHYCLV